MMLTSNFTQRRATVITGARARGLELLAMGHTRVEVARQLGINRSSVHRWLDDQSFVRELEKMRNLVVTNCHQRLLALVPMALDALEQDLTDPLTPRPLRQRAALEVLDRANLEVRVPIEHAPPPPGSGQEYREKMKRLPLEDLDNLHGILIKLQDQSRWRV